MMDAQALTAAHKPSTYTFYSGTVGIFEAASPDVKNRSFEMTATVTIPDEGAEGVLVAMGGRMAATACSCGINDCTTGTTFLQSNRLA